jgi:hypothetical protein
MWNLRPRTIPVETWVQTFERVTQVVRDIPPKHVCEVLNLVLANTLTMPTAILVTRIVGNTKAACEDPFTMNVFLPWAERIVRTFAPGEGGESVEFAEFAQALARVLALNCHFDGGGIHPTQEALLSMIAALSTSPALSLPPSSSSPSPSPSLWKRLFCF